MQRLRILLDGPQFRESLQRCVLKNLKAISG
jgi:hypothetical protein